MSNETTTNFIDMSWFYGRAKTLEPNAIISKAEELNVDPHKFEAMFLKESSRGPFLPDGRPTILFEAHKFSQYTKRAYDNTHPNISSKSWNRSLYGQGGSHQYERLRQAMALDPHAALMSCSWGAFQIMGFNYEDCGYESVEDMVRAFTHDAQAHLDAFANILRKWGLITALQSWDVDAIGYRYNGPGYQQNNYANDLNRIYNELKSSSILSMGSRGSKVKSLQLQLKRHGFKASADGYFGSQTEQYVKDFQASRGLTVDGKVGPQVWSELATLRGNQTTVVGSKRVKGAAVTATAGGGLLADALSGLGDTADQVKAATDSLRSLGNNEHTNTAINLISAQQDNQWFMAAVGLGLILVAGYFVWTKWFDER